MKVILVEFNELTPSLMDRFLKAGHLPHFARLRSESQVLTTHAAERGTELEPWIQWVSVHSGLPYERHGVFHLGQGHDLKAPRTWDLASEAGKSVWICGSMNAYSRDAVRGHFLPDPWAAQALPEPVSLLPFFRFVQANVQDHRRNTPGLGLKDYLAFLGFMLRHGLSFSTVAATLRQVLSERGKRGRNRWKRAAILDRLQFDLFRSVYKRERPDFATFFSNSTAHFQHHFWRHLEPGVFTHKPPAGDLRDYGDAILYGYRQMDRLLGKILALADKDTAVVFCTGLSQEPCLLFEDVGGGMTYRPADFDAVARFAGVDFPYALDQAMASRFGIRFESEEAAAKAAALFEDLRVGDERAFLQVDLQGRAVLLDCGFHKTPLEPLPFYRAAHPEKKVPFGDLFYAYGQFNGMHNPDGMLWARIPGLPGREIPEKLPLTSVAPTLLRLLNVPVPREMTSPAFDFGA